MQESDEQAETFNRDQQEMFQNPGTAPGETRPRTPGTETLPPFPTPGAPDAGKGEAADEQLSNS